MATPPDIPAEEWNLLFDAVLARLREAAGRDAPGTVLECAEALEKLRAMLPPACRQRDLGARGLGG